MAEDKLRVTAASESIYWKLRSVETEFDLRSNELVQAAEGAVRRIRSMMEQAATNRAAAPAHDPSDGLRFDPDFGPLEESAPAKR